MAEINSRNKITAVCLQEIWDIPNKFVSNEKVLSGSIGISKSSNDFISETGPNLAKQIPKSENHNSSFNLEHRSSDLVCNQDEKSNTYTKESFLSSFFFQRQQFQE